MKKQNHFNYLIIAFFIVFPIFAFEFHFESDDIYIIEKQHKIQSPLQTKQEKHKIYLSVENIQNQSFTLSGTFTTYSRNPHKEETYKKEEEYPSRFILYSNGSYQVERNVKYPNYLGIPTFPEKKNPLPKEWKKPAYEILWLPEWNLKITIPFEVHYHYEGIEEKEYFGEKTHAHKIKFHYRIHHRVVPAIGPIAKIMGSSEGILYFSEKYQIPIFDEQKLYYEFHLKNQQVLREFIEIESTYRKIKKLKKEELAKRVEKELEDFSIPIEPKENGVEINLGNILFDFDSYKIKPDAYPVLEKISEVLKKLPEREIQIYGHTDNIGDEDYNLELSEKRAKAIADFLKDKGIPPERISYKGMGSQKPLYPNDTPENRAKNRRVEIFIPSE
ncbi:MAG: OmpA family protein [Leptospiraceae bacterium]|nr:OmpA family protein [Leptospiraceae bacterium]MDW7975335.1 OmpA family protein [Leptospiraceae bacterium]